MFFLRASVAFNVLGLPPFLPFWREARAFFSVLIEPRETAAGFLTGSDIYMLMVISFARTFHYLVLSCGANCYPATLTSQPCLIRFCCVHTVSVYPTLGFVKG